MSETSTKPYLIRALHEWCTDNGYTPFLTVTVDARTVVPREHIKDGEIVLNVGSLATYKLELGNEFVEFQARFGGVARQISVPIDAVTAIYARETGQGMAFEATPMSDVPTSPARDAPPAQAPESSEGNGGKRVGLASVPSAVPAAVPAAEAADDAGVAETPPDPDGPETPPPAPPERGRPTLKIIK
jgi:stringent starvation protein B